MGKEMDLLGDYAIISKKWRRLAVSYINTEHVISKVWGSCCDFCAWSPECNLTFYLTNTEYAFYTFLVNTLAINPTVTVQNLVW